MNDRLRARIAHALSTLGAVGYRDTTSPGTRPQWRASFSYRGQLTGETSFLQLFVPVDRDEIQVNCTLPAPVLNAVPADLLQTAVAEVEAVSRPGTGTWENLLAEIGAEPEDVRGWTVKISPHYGIETRMVLVRVRLPLAALSDRALDLAVKLGYRLGRRAREAVALRGDEQGWKS